MISGGITHQSMQSEKNLAKKISLISTSVFTLFLICLVLFTRFFLIYREQVILQDIDATPIKNITFWENYIWWTSMMYMWAVEGTSALPIIDISTWMLVSSIGNIPDIWSLTPQQVNVSSDAGIIFEALRDSVFIPQNQWIIKNGIFQFTDITEEDFIWKPEYFSQRVQGKVFLFRKIEEESVIVYISRDITNIELLIINLIKLSIGAIMIFVIAIYFLSRFFAQLTISPIRKNNMLLREFNHSLAHEIKTPLSVIRLNLESLETKISSKLVSSAVEEVDIISSITDTMLFISEWTILRESEEHKFSDYIRNFVDRYYPWKIEIIGSSDHITEVTSILFDRILTNLCENALKYGQSKPIIRISNNIFSIENTTKKDIDNDSLGKLGTPFFQIHTENRKTWNWLGLSIVRRIIEILWWKITFTYEDKIFKVITEPTIIDKKD